MSYLETLSYFATEELQHILSFSFVTVCAVILCFSLLELFEFFFNYITTRHERKKFRKRVEDSSYTVNVFHLGPNNLKCYVEPSEPDPYLPNCVICQNEENARLICMTLNSDALGKQFNIKAYLKGSGINKLKSSEERQKEVKK